MDWCSVYGVAELALSHTILSEATTLRGKSQLSHLWSNRLGVEPYTNLQTSEATTLRGKSQLSHNFQPSA